MIRAVIFDLDGTLVDTEPLHFAAFAEVLRAEGIELTRDEYFSRLIGLNDHDCFRLVLPERIGSEVGASESRIKDLVERKSAAYLKMIDGRDLAYPGADEFVRQCAARFPLMIATGTLRSEAELILRRTGLLSLFAGIIASEDVEHGKPEPDSFVAALGRLGFMLRSRPPIKGEECLVIEDTVAGIDAAHRAGMKVLALAHTTPESELASAEIVRRSFADTGLDDVLRRLSRSR